MRPGFAARRFLFRRGSALLAVLVLSALMLLLLLAFATSSTSNLSLTRLQVDGVRGDALARAAVQEFLVQLQQVQPPSDATQVPPSVFEHFRHNQVLISRDSRLGCEARLLTEGRYRSLDNSLSSVPTQSCFDGPQQKSLPPFSLSLVMEIEAGRRTFLYEAFLQQVWPYALAAPGPIRVFGSEVAQDMVGADGLGGETYFRGRQLGGWRGTSSIQGPVLASQSDLAPPPQNPGGEPVSISEIFYSRLFGFSKGHPSISFHSDLPNTRLQLGGEFSVLNYRPRTRISYNDSGTELRTTTWEAQTVGLRTENARIEGGIDLFENPCSLGEPVSTSEVYVAPAAVHEGRVRNNFRFRGLDPNSQPSRQMLAKMFVPPDTSTWTRIQNDELALLTGETTLSSGRRVSGGSRVITIPTGQVRYEGDIKLGTSDSDFPSLVLEDLALAVKGNVILGPGTSGDRPTLRGSNATLMVEGSLIVDNGQLDAGGNGMVIFCRDFIIKAQGRYNGLILSQRGGAFVGSDPGEGSSVQAGDEASELVIRGGVIVGGRHLTVEGPPPHDPVLPHLFPPIRLDSLAMISTRIEYDPKYLRTVNQFGNFRLVAVQRR
jgi:hypothetical protein